jgi:hypothetical protein
MSSPLRDPKQLTEWQELDYFKRPSPFRRLWRIIPWTAFFLGLAVVAVWTFVPRAQVVYEAGPVSTAHRLFNDDCRRCHTETFQTLHRFVTHNPSIHAVTDDACSQCHAGPAHHPKKVSHETACVSCHREHHGRAALARVPDGDCVSCHRDLAAGGMTPGAKTEFQNVPGFDRHPDFVKRWEGKPNDDKPDPGTIRFNHKLHLDPGGVAVRDAKQIEAQWGEKPPRDPVRLRKLECADCHQPDEAGRYLKPINHEQHCGSCHPLTVQVSTTLQTPEALKARQEFAAQPAPHRDPATVRAALRQRLTAFIQQADHQAFLGVPEKEEPPRPVPGAWTGPPPVSKEQFEWVNRQLQQVEDVLFNKPGGCAFCHQEEHPTKRRADGLPEYAPPRINSRTFPEIGASTRWFPHSRFSHVAHQMLDCAACHHDIRASERTSELHMPKLADCRVCHREASGKARGDCAECHTYHPQDEKEKFRGRWIIDNGSLRLPP